MKNEKLLELANEVVEEAYKQYEVNSIDEIKAYEDYSDNSVIGLALKVIKDAENGMHIESDSWTDKVTTYVFENVFTTFHQFPLFSLEDSLDDNEKGVRLDLARENYASEIYISDEEGTWSSYKDALNAEKWWDSEWDNDKNNVFSKFEESGLSMDDFECILEGGVGAYGGTKTEGAFFEHDGVEIVALLTETYDSNLARDVDTNVSFISRAEYEEIKDELWDAYNAGPINSKLCNGQVKL